MEQHINWMQAVRPGGFGRAKRRVWAGNLFPKVSGTWHGVAADFFFSLAPQEGVSSGFFAHLVAFLRVGFCRGFVLGEMNLDKSA